MGRSTGTGLRKEKQRKKRESYIRIEITDEQRESRGEESGESRKK
jgi:hypothetical protein